MLFKDKTGRSIDITIYNEEGADIINKAAKRFYKVTLSDKSTEPIKDMRNMFLECASLTSVDLSDLNTSDAKKMSYMFKDVLGM